MSSSPTSATPETSDNALLERTGRGDREAFARLYDRLSTPLYSLAVQMLGDRTEAEDVFLEGMEELWRKAPGYDPTRASAFTWAVMIFRSRVIDRVRKRSSRDRTRNKAREESEVLGNPGNEMHLPARREEWRLVREAVDALEPAKAQLLRWSFFDGMTHGEIAERSGRPLGTVKTTIRRALLELRGSVLGKGVER